MAGKTEAGCGARPLLESDLHAIDRLRRQIARRLYVSKGLENKVVDQFHTMFWDLGALKQTWGDSKWLGVHVQKLPFDLWVYQEILFELRPELIIETGTASGGSALFLAGVCDLLDHGSIVTVDVKLPANPPRHPRIRYITGSSVDDDVLSEVTWLATGKSPVLVILDSDHTCPHVLKELHSYTPMVTPGSYAIVEDTNTNGHPVYPDFGPGPMEAVHAFLAETEDFKIDKSREKFLISFNPDGFLKKNRQLGPRRSGVVTE